MKTNFLTTILEVYGTTKESDRIDPKENDRIVISRKELNRLLLNAERKGRREIVSFTKENLLGIIREV